ncbi:MAG: hypothetical protein HY925_15705 [Elusimicrobia bacterium]|nr:hypothetical protein [Elusimicrobiota bacterium]
MAAFWAVLLALGVWAQEPSEDSRVRFGYEEVELVGWNDGCSVAIRHFRYPPSVEGAQVEPNWGRLGTVSLDPDQTRPSTRWALQVKEGFPFSKGYELAGQEQLSRGGYKKPGFTERVRPEPVASGRDLDLVIHTTSSLEVGYTVPYASAPYVLSSVHYSPLSTCAFLVFKKPGHPPNLYKYQLVRVPVDVRRRRAQAHLTNALLLYKKQSDTYGALEEAEVAAAMDPRLAEGRYQYAVMLALHGRFDESLKELHEAVLIDGKWAKEAKLAVEFEDLWKQPRFKQALVVPAGTMPLDPL